MNSKIALSCSQKETRNLFIINLITALERPINILSVRLHEAVTIVKEDITHYFMEGIKS